MKQEEAMALMMRGQAAKEGITSQMEDVISELESMHLKYKNMMGEKGELAFACGLAVFSAELTS